MYYEKIKNNIEFNGRSGFFVMPGQMSATGKFGSDSVNCVKYLNFYRDSYKQGNMKEAARFGEKPIKYEAKQNMFIGAKILESIVLILTR